MNNDTDRQKRHFDRIAANYAAARVHENHRELKRLIWREFLARHNELRRPGLKVLDAMCGFADAKNILEETLDIPVDYTGFDYSDSVVDSIRRSNPELKVTKADVVRYTTSETFDVVVLLGGLHHVPNHAEEAVARLSRYIRPDGYFISFEPIDGNDLFRLVRAEIYRRNDLFDAATERAFENSELFGFFSGAGLTLVDVLYPGLLSYVLYYNPDAFPSLNVGSPRFVRAIFKFERPIMRRRVAQYVSFAALTLWRKRGDPTSPV